MWLKEKIQVGEKYKTILSFTSTGLMCALVISIQTACSVQGGIKKSTQDSTALDLSKTTVSISNDNSEADGEQASVIKITLRDKKDRPLAGITPDAISLPSGVTTAPCSVSDANGESFCVIKASSSGSKTLELQIKGQTVSTTLNFQPPQPPKPGFAASGSGIEVQTSGVGAGQIVALSSIGEIAHHEIVITDGTSPGVDSLEGGIISTAQGGSQTMAHPILSGPATMYRPFAMTNMAGVLYPTP